MYRPNQRDSCCPHYTLRLDSDAFRPTRDQRQTINRFNAHITGAEYTKEASRLYPRTKEQSKKRNNEFDFLERVHEAEYPKLKTPPEPAHRLTITLETDECTEEKFAVYQNYQRIIHKDKPHEITKDSFTRFLCDSPVRRYTETRADGSVKRLGSYHQCYRLDGELVAVGVLDLLPQCVSSVYFFYHESIHKFSPGKFGALQEIALAKEEGYRWWYPGYYIHSCPKMHYKVDYSPQYILDPVTLDWDPLDKTVLALLDRFPYLSLSQHRAQSAAKEAKSESAVGNGGIDNQSLENDKEDSKDNKDNKDNENNENNEDNEDKVDNDKDDSDDADDDIESDDKDSESSDDVGYHRSVFEGNMPGVPQLAELEDVNMDQIRVWGPSPFRLYCMSDLVGWEETTIYEWPRIKSRMAELVAAMGLDTPPKLCIDVMRR